jgi:hypothetical protein
MPAGKTSGKFWAYGARAGRRGFVENHSGFVDGVSFEQLPDDGKRSCMVLRAGQLPDFVDELVWKHVSGAR